MFGTLRPALCRLPTKDRQAYRRAYCGTCKALGDYGLLARPLLSYDIVFLAALVESTRQDASETSTCRCPLLPILQKPIIAPSSVSVRVAAAVQVILASAWFDDQVLDGNPTYRPARSLAQSKANKAHEELALLRIPLSRALGLGIRQSEVEARSKDIRQLAAPTSDILIEFLVSIPNLPNSMPMSEESQAALARLGGALGLAIYAVDALEDLEGDVQRGRFNPCIDDTGLVDASAVQRTSDILSDALVGIEEALGSVSVLRGERALRAATQGLAKRARSAMNTAADRLPQWKELRKKRAWERWLRATWVSLLWLPVWLFGRGRKVALSTRALFQEPIDAKACSGVHAFAAENGDPGSGLGHPGEPSTPHKKKRKSGCCGCWDCCDCGTDCCCCLHCSGDGDCCDGDCCDGGCCDCGDCCSCDC